MFGYDSAKVIETEVFASLPDEYRKVKKGLTLEGPSFDRAGNLYFTDLHNGRIFKADPSGTVTLVSEYGGNPNGLKIHKDGRIFVVDRAAGLLLLDPANGNVTPVLSGPEGERFLGLNDLFFASNGDLYFSDQGETGLHNATGRLYRYSEADGSLVCLLDTCPSPNGLTFNRSERVMYLAATRANAIWLVPVDKKSGVAKVGLFVNLPCPGPDGLALDDAGNLAVAHPGIGAVWLFDRRGLPIYRVQSCEGARTINIAYGGESNQWLYITEADSGTILRARMPVAGKVLFSHL